MATVNLGHTAFRVCVRGLRDTHSEHERDERNGQLHNERTGVQRNVKVKVGNNVKMSIVALATKVFQLRAHAHASPGRD